jgi:serine/threonine protein kinase
LLDNMERKQCQHLHPGISTEAAFRDLDAKNRLQVGSFSWENIIGVGSPSHGSKVYKVIRRDGGQVFAMKVLSKRRLLAQQPAQETDDIRWCMDGVGGLVDRRGIDIDPSMHLSTAKLAAEGAHEQSRGVQHLMHELALLKMLPPSPFLVHCTCAFQDEYHCYFGLEYMHGGDLRHYLNARMHTLDYKEVRFYVASMTLALVHLHSNGILHRDVRPENILIDSKG